MANIYKRGQTWWGRVQKKGEELRRSLETRSESVARERLAAWIADLEAQAWGAKPRLTLNEVADAFIREHGPGLRPSTLRRYGVSIDWLDQRLGDKLLLAIGSAELKDFETWRRSMGATAPTVRRDLAALSSIFSFAIENEWADANPVGPFLRQRRKRGLRESPPRTRYLTRAEEARLLEGAMPYVRDAILFAIYSGLRQEELFSLTWDQVDLARRQVTIAAETAKGRRERVAILLAPAVDVLNRAPRHLRSRYVFHHGAASTKGRGAARHGRARLKARNDGERFNHLDRGLRRAAARAKVRNLRWHDLRRTHGCRLLQEERWSLEMVRDQLGHTSVAQTERAYAFLEVEARRRAATPAGTETGTTANPPNAAPDKDLVEIDAATGEPIAAQKPAQGRRTDLEKRKKSKA